MFILKFGGSSVASDQAIRQVAGIVRQSMQQAPCIVVVSALGGITDLLLHCGSQAAAGDPAYRNGVQLLMDRHVSLVKGLLPPAGQAAVLSRVISQCHEVEAICDGIALLNECSGRVRDRLAAYGELLSSQVISAYLQAEGLENQWVDARQLLCTDASFTKATILAGLTTERIRDYFSERTNRLFVVPGFIAATETGDTTTLGRGGSDYTAALLGAALDAARVEIWTDVTGMMTADPRLVPRARTIPQISFQEAMELSHFGAKVIYPPTIQPLQAKGLSVWVKNTFAPAEEGTLIHAGEAGTGNTVRGISSIAQVALLSLEGSGMVGIPGFSKRLFESLARHSINVIFITQASSEHTICVGVEEGTMQLARIVVDEEFRNEIRDGKLNPLCVEPGLAIVALVGDGMKNHTGTSGKMFSALGRNGVNIRAIAQGSSERNISVVITAADVKKALNVLHEEFFESVLRQINLFVVGAGNVGARLLHQLRQQRRYLQEKMGLQLRLVGLANSRRMLIREEGIDLDRWSEELALGEPMDIDAFVAAVRSRNLRNSIFVDVTANAAVASVYEALLEKSISVVACNKIAPSSAFSHYSRLKWAAREYNTRFLFETNVGAGLPVINTLEELLNSGDQVTHMEAVLSGTLNFVFNQYDGSKPFAEIVQQAQAEGYTEPDPRLDLSGTDVMRKILILAREAGHVLDMEDIANESFLPASCMEGTVADFYRELARHEDHFRSLHQEATRARKKLKYVARFENGKASVGLRTIDPSHDFFHLYGKDNAVVFYTTRYVEQPLVVKGAGAGADVTASGVFADIVRAARN